MKDEDKKSGAKEKKPPPRTSANNAGSTMNKIKRRLSHKLNNETGDLTQWVPRHHSGKKRRKVRKGRD